MKRLLLSLAILLASATPALGHTQEELDSWSADLRARAAEMGWIETEALSEEWRDMVRRHPCFPEAHCPEPVRATNSAPGASVQVARPSGTAPTSVEAWRPLVAAYWPPNLVEWALRIIACESVGDPGAVNPSSGAAGLFQFLPSTWNNMVVPALGFGSYSSGAPFDPTTNVRAAAWLYAAEGPSQWSCKA